MSEQATIVDFLSASLRGLEASRPTVLSPKQQDIVDQITVTLDLELDKVVRELERVASCQQPPSGESEEEPLPPFEAFCVGLKTIGDTLLPHLVTVYKKHCLQHQIPLSPFMWIVRARVDAFVAYLLQIAQVHGLAFDETRTKMSKGEQIALANLGAYLRALMQREMDGLLVAK